MNVNTRALRALRDQLELATAKALASFEADTGLTVEGVYLKRSPTTIGARHGDIIGTSIEVVL